MNDAYGDELLVLGFCPSWPVDDNLTLILYDTLRHIPTFFFEP